MLSRLVIDDVRPRTPAGYPAKAVVDEVVPASATVLKDGHDILGARVLWRPTGTKEWSNALLTAAANDRFEGTFSPREQGTHEIAVEAWTDRYATWRHDVELKAAAGDPLDTELEEGALIISSLLKYVPEDAQPRLRDAVAGLRRASCSRDVRLNAGLDDAVGALLHGIPDPVDKAISATHRLWVDRPRARAGAWYELFPRSEGGLASAMKRLRDIADMSFDIVYLPPIHPIGVSHRKGPNNTLHGGAEAPGSPWAIGSEHGGHTAVAPELGTIDDFDRFVAEAESLGLEVALDYALQCSPDHPWVTDHPEWFHHRPDGSIKYAENPPKKYQDIYPINFWPKAKNDRVALWDACKEIVDYWIGHGVTIFRVDNPHTKPFAFWEWLIPAVQAERPDIVFLAEAFTRPAVMAKLAEIGFSQSYTYFTWRTAKWELQEYLDELAHGPLADYMRPKFWPNTPDILSGPLRGGPPAAFQLRLVLAATMAPSYGIYSGYELCENEPMSETNEEYLHSEKYEIKRRDWDDPSSLASFISLVNDIRRAHPAFDELRTIQFHQVDNDSIIAYSKHDPSGGDVVLCIVNLDPSHWQEATLALDLAALDLGQGAFEAHDELTGVTYAWDGPQQYVRLDPDTAVAHLLHLRRPLVG